MAFRTGARVLGVLSGGRLTSRYNDLIYILSKPAAGAQPAGTESAQA